MSGFGGLQCDVAADSVGEREGGGRVLENTDIYFHVWLRK